MHTSQLAHKPSTHQLAGSITGQGATIPEYFRKRISKQQKSVDQEQCDDENNQRKEEKDVQDESVVVVDEDESEYETSEESDTSEEETEPEEKEEEKVQQQIEIPDPTKFSVLKQEIKEYCAIQEKVQIIISMLKSRAEELEKENEINAEAKKEVQVKDETKVEEASIKNEQPEIDNSDLESLKKYYENSDEDEPEVIDEKPKDKNDSDVELVEEVDSKPQIVFVDANALEDDTKDEKPIVINSKQCVLPTKSLKDISTTDLFDPTFSTIKLEPIAKKCSVVDSLFNKFNLKIPTSPPKPAPGPSAATEQEKDAVNGRLRERRKTATKPRYVDEDTEPKKVRPSKIFDKIHKQLNLDFENSNSSSSTEFYGFDEGDVVKLDKPSVPGLLPTPIVKKSRPNAPFLAPGTIAEDIKIENRDDLFREEGLISFGSLPPRLECPRRPDDMVRPRTVAQKRILLQKKNDVRYLMIDNESKIFNEIEKRSKNIDVALDQERMQELQDQAIPFTRDTWKALAWLRTEKGKYFFQTLRVDNHYVKLAGCKGNHAAKRLGKKQLSTPATVSRKLVCHCPEYPPNVNIDLSLIQPLDEAQIKAEPKEPSMVETEQDRKMLCNPTKPSIRTQPGPLSSKLRFDYELLNRTEDGHYLGPLEIFEMPSVQIEVFPRIDRPLDPTVKPYLKMMLPFHGITEKWARFAVSTLKTPDRKEEDIPEEDKSFSFTMPYLNNHRRILIRRRKVLQSNLARNSPAESLDRFEQEMKEPLTFRKHLDDPVQEGSSNIDPVEKECADVLSELTNAVAISLSGDVFVRNDPDCDYTKEDKPVERSAPQQESTKNLENAAKSKRMLREMKRLNATIIETIPEPSPSSTSLAEDGKPRCDERYCAHGCICDVFNIKHGGLTRRMHCGKVDCIFGCQCGYDKKRSVTKDLKPDISEDGLSALTSEDVKYLREKATAKLAKEERDFTPTVIMTNNSTVLVRNTDTDTRRHKKKPKKYDDYYNENSVKSLMSGIVPDEEEPRETSVERSKTSSVIGNQPLCLADRIRHTHVVLNKLQDLDQVEPWCMIHCLYRCYCHGNATHGKPFKFNEESDIVLPTPASIPTPDPLLTVYEPRRRRLYSFEKTESTITTDIRDPHRKRDSSEESYKPWSERRKKKRKTLEEQSQSSPDKKASGESAPSSTRASIEDLQINDGQICRRAIPVNRNFYRTRNYYRKSRYLEEIEESKRKYPHAEKRLKHLLEKCEQAFFDERKQELEEQARKVMKERLRQRHSSEGDIANSKSKKHTPTEPIFFDIIGTDAKIQQNVLLAPLVDMEKSLVYCGKKKYYVNSEAITNGKINLMNIARRFRRAVYILKRVESDPRAKPITFSFRNETIMLKGRKYRLLEPYTQQENEHVDFDCESDDQESVSTLIQESPTVTEDDAQKVMLDQVNSDIMHTMQHIREMMRKNTARLNPPKKGILYLFRWEKFLQAFNEDHVDVWDITFQNGSELVILTTESTRKNAPVFKNTKSVRLARKCTLESRGTSLLTKMVLHQIDNPETNKLSLVLFGTENHWRFCGFIKAENNYLDKGCEVRPTPASHPKLAPKINRYYEAYVASRKKGLEATQKSSPSLLSTSSNPVQVPKPIKEEIPIEQKPNPLMIPSAIMTIKSNIRLMETKIKDFKNIAIPNVGMRRWFMLNVVNDFSDIYIPSWKSCLTYARIKQAIQLANRYRKTVRLSSIVQKNNPEDVLPQIYAAPMQGECIFLGPYNYTQNIDLILCQNVDGKMFTREEYERNNHIVRTDRTTGSWLYMKPNMTSTTTPSSVVPDPEPPLPASKKPLLRTNSTATTDSFSNDDDCVVIEDDEESVEAPVAVSSPPKEVKEPTPEAKPVSVPDQLSSQNNSQLESLINQLYNDSDSDDEGTPLETSSIISKVTSGTNSATTSAEQLVPPPIQQQQQQQQQQQPKNQLSLLVDKTIAESKQIQIKPPASAVVTPPIVTAKNSAISVRRMSYVPAPTFATPAAVAEKKKTQIAHRRLSYIPTVTTVVPHSQCATFTKLTNVSGANLTVKRKSTGSTEIEILSSAGDEKRSRLSLPSTSASMPAAVPAAKDPENEEIVCLDDEDDKNDDVAEKTGPSSVPPVKVPSCTTVLNSQQAALIASKINLLNPKQKGVVYNPSTGVLRIKRSLMNSLSKGTDVTMPSTKTVLNSALGNPTPTSAPQAPVVSPTAEKSVPTSVIPPATPKSFIMPEAGVRACIDPPKVPTEGILRSNIPGLGAVPVQWSSSDIIIKVRELSVKQQFVRLAGFEAAVVLLNRFIRKNTYTFKPFSLTIGWKFEARSDTLPAQEQLINTINLRCVVTNDGVIDLYKASAIIAFQNTKPNFYEELLLLRLSILCCKKEQYEQEQCHKYFEKIFIKATNTIKELTQASEALTTQSNFLREQQTERRALLDKLKANQAKEKPLSKRIAVLQSALDSASKSRPSTSLSSTAKTPAASGQQKESVIVLDDD